MHAEGDDPNRYKVAKQADTVMLFFLFSPSELRSPGTEWPAGGLAGTVPGSKPHRTAPTNETDVSTIPHRWDPQHQGRSADGTGPPVDPRRRSDGEHELQLL